jgi:adiponectin receptor
MAITATAYFVLSPGYSTPAYRRVRTFLFIGLGVSGVVPVLHKVLSQGVSAVPTREGAQLSQSIQYEQANQCLGLDWLLIGGAFYIVGALM